MLCAGEHVRIELIQVNDDFKGKTVHAHTSPQHHTHFGLDGDYHIKESVCVTIESLHLPHCRWKDHCKV